MNQHNKIIIIIVLYKTLAEESRSYKYYTKYKHLLDCEHQLIIFNNSPEITITNIQDAIIINSTENKKLNTAYNFALKYANENIANWLLLLDSDSKLTEDYFIELSNTLNSKIDNNIVSIVPTLIQNNKTISPHRHQFMYLRCNPTNKQGVINGKIIAFNSLSLLRVSFLNEINGFSPKFPLDMLDYWVYSQIEKKRKSVLLLESKIEHDLSVTNFEENMTLNRYKDLILSEKKFFRELGLGYQIAYRLKLLLRSMKQFIVFKNKEFSKITLNQMFK